MQVRTIVAIVISVAWVALSVWFFRGHQISPSDPLASFGSFLQGAGTPLAVVWAMMAYWQVSEQISLTKRAQDAQDATQAEQQRLNAETIAAFRRHADLAKDQLDHQRAATFPHIIKWGSIIEPGVPSRLVSFRNFGGRAFEVKAECVTAGTRCESPPPQVIHPSALFDVRIAVDSLDAWNRAVEVRFTYRVVDGERQERVVPILPST